MAFVVRVLPSPPPPPPEPATPARWCLAMAVTRAVGLASAGVFIASFAVVSVGSLYCGDDEESSVLMSTLGENCPMLRPVFTVFRVSAISTALAIRLLDLLRTCLARSKAKQQKAAARVKFLDYAIIFEHLVPTACVFLLTVGILLERSAKGYIMETVASVILYLGLGMMGLICGVLAILAVVAVVMVLCIVMATAMAVWESCNTVETKPEEKELNVPTTC